MNKVSNCQYNRGRNSNFLRRLYESEVIRKKLFTPPDSCVQLTLHFLAQNFSRMVRARLEVQSSKFESSLTTIAVPFSWAPFA